MNDRGHYGKHAVGAGGYVPVFVPALDGSLRERAEANRTRAGADMIKRAYVERLDPDEFVNAVIKGGL